MCYFPVETITDNVLMICSITWTYALAENKYMLTLDLSFTYDRRSPLAMKGRITMGSFL